MSGTLLGTSSTLMKMTGNVSALMDSIFIGGRYTITKQMMSSTISAIKQTIAVQEH